jgi:phage major head subunit gpT-like protein
MLINSPNLQVLFQGYQFIFQGAYDKAPTGWLDQIATRVPSDTEEEIHFWLAQIPKMREWIGERAVQNMASYEYKLKNKHFELTEELDKNRVADDKHGFFGSHVVPMMASQVKKAPDYLLRDLLRTAQSSVIWDGQNFFDASHPISKFPGSGISGTQSNYYSSGKALSYDNVVAVRSAMMLFKAEDGESLGVSPNLLVVPPQLGPLARSIAQAEYAPVVYGSNTAATVQPNAVRGTFEVLELPELGADATTWYMLDTSKPVKPFLFQERQAPQFQSLVSPTDPKVFWLKKFTFGVDARWVPGFGPWFLASKCVA